MTWLLLAEGAPPQPTDWDLQELASAPRVDEFLKRLFAEFCGTKELPPHVTEQRVVPNEQRVARGFCGTEQAGYRFVEKECLETKAVPYDVAIETYGLPGIALHWRYCLDYVGQAGYAAFRHISLKAWFDDSEAEKRFRHIWRSVFNTVPVWQAVDGA